MLKRETPRFLTGLAMAAVAMLLCAAPAGAQATTEQPAESTHPPTTGRFVGDHWTPYEPPSVESFPQGSNVHIIVPGDTLWDLSQTYLDDPFLWPQIWDVNQYITDSHWIYPGDPVLIPGKPTVIGEAGPEPAIEMIEPPVPQEPEGEEATGEPAAAPAPVASAVPELEPVAEESDVYCTSYIVDVFDPPALEIREREDGSRTILGTGDIVFLNQGLDSNLTPGQEFSIISYEGVVPHPIFDEKVGEAVKMVGRLQVIALQERTATAQITLACDGVRLGMRLVPFEEIPIPLTTPVEFRRYGVQLDTATAGYIVETSPRRANLGSGDVVNIDLGADSGVQPGDVLTIFREWGGAVEFSSTESYIEGQQARAETKRARGKLDPSQFAQVILGQLVVLKTQEHTATGKIIMSAREISLGDRVAMR